MFGTGVETFTEQERANFATLTILLLAAGAALTVDATCKDIFNDLCRRASHRARRTTRDRPACRPPWVVRRGYSALPPSGRAAFASLATARDIYASRSALLSLRLSLA